MNNIVVVDASVWISWLLAQDINHDASLFWMERYISKSGVFITPTFLFIEVGGALSRITGQDVKAKEALKNIMAINSIHVTPMNSSFVQHAIQVAIDLRLRAGDATYVAVAHRLNIPLISWDREQVQRAGSLIAAYTPNIFPFTG